MDLNKLVLPSNKKFGISFSLIFLIVSIYFTYSSFFFIATIFFFFSIALIIFAFFLPSYLYYLNKYWMLFGYYLSLIVNPLVLGFIYFIILTPFALVRRKFTKDELNLKFSKNFSYWEKRNNTSISPKSFFKQF